MDGAWFLFASSFYGKFQDCQGIQPTPLPGQVVRFIVKLAAAPHFTVVEIAPIEHADWSHAGILYRRPAEELDKVLKDTRAVHRFDPPDAHVYTIRDLLIEQANERQDAEAWLKFAGKQDARGERGADVDEGAGASHGVDSNGPVGGDAAPADKPVGEGDGVDANNTFTIPKSHAFDFVLPPS
ncbi:hypothetical protein J3F83DRAFT_713474 [Trichoderma novae-zelandiae]